MIRSFAILLGLATLAVSCDTPVQTVSKSKLKSDSQFITSVYFDVLGQRVPAEDLGLIVAALRASADPVPVRSIMVRQLVYSPEAQIPDRDDIGDMTIFVENTFEKLLQRAPTEDELSRFTTELNTNPDFGPRGVYEVILSSTEYQYY